MIGVRVLDRLLGEFASFWREHGDTLFARAAYHEVAPQLVLMAYLQRVVNGGGIMNVFGTINSTNTYSGSSINYLINTTLDSLPISLTVIDTNNCKGTITNKTKV